MSMTLSARLEEKRVPWRLALFGFALIMGILVGTAWGTSAGPDWAYWGFLQLFLDPRVQIAGLGVGVSLGFLAGFIHITRL